MKQLKSVMAILLAVAMLLCFAGCKEETAAGTTKAETIVGSWTCAMDISEYMNEYMGDAGLDGFEMDETPLCIYMAFDFEDDGSCVLYLDEDATLESMQTYIDNMLVSLLDYMYEMYEDELDMTREEIDEYFKDYAGMTLEEYFNDAMAESLTPEVLTDSLSGFENQEGYYKLDGEKLYIADTEEELAECEDYVTCKISGDKMTIDVGTDEDEFADFEEMGIELPLVFEKN